MVKYFANFIARGAFCLFILNAKAASCDANTDPADFVKMQPIANSSPTSSEEEYFSNNEDDTHSASDDSPIVQPEATEQPLMASADTDFRPLLGMGL